MTGSTKPAPKAITKSSNDWGDTGLVLLYAALTIRHLGEVEASVFDRYRTPLYKEASYKPYIIAAMIFLAKSKDPAAALKALEDRAQKRKFC